MRQTRQAIEQLLRQRIQDGVYAVASRMPSHRQLQSELGASSVTLQRAFNRLVEQGYVERRGALGTFVAGALPNHSSIALVFAQEPGERSWNRFWSTIKRVGDDWKKGGITFRVYHMAGERADAPDHLRLQRDLAEGGLGGVVFVGPPAYLGDSPVFASPVPRVCISLGGERTAQRYGASVVQFTDNNIYEPVLRAFATAGRQRLAVLTGLGGLPAAQGRCRPLLRELKLETRSEWWLELPMDASGAVCARGVTRLLCSLPERQRPDCLLITDDNLVIPATAGIVEAGLLAPRDLLVAAHANFPAPTPAAVPCTRFGPDLEELFTLLVDEIARLAAGGTRRCVQLEARVREAAAR